MLFALLLACSGVLPTAGCGTGVKSSPLRSATSDTLTLIPATVTIDVGNEATFAVSDGSSCTWSTNDPLVLSSQGEGKVIGVASGSSEIIASCHGETLVATGVVAPNKANKSAIMITSGGTYTGDWESTNPTVAAVTIATNERVVLKNSTVTGVGNLITVLGKGSTQIVIENVTGTELDPKIYGAERGAFLEAHDFDQLTVTHCTMHGVSFGIMAIGSKASKLSITNNAAFDMEDRESDGKGGFLNVRGSLGHFIIINNVVTASGAEIAWNQLIDTVGGASTEDAINIYESQGAPQTPILVHDNYLQGLFATGQATYDGAGIEMDGDTTDPKVADAFINVYNNSVVQVAHAGIAISAGHDITMTNNRVVSCGKDVAGNWVARSTGNAMEMWNFYNTNLYYNNSITGTTGGLVRPDANGNPTEEDVFAPSLSAEHHVTLTNNNMEHPCLNKGVLTMAPEAAERAAWLLRASTAAESIGDQQ